MFNPCRVQDWWPEATTAGATLLLSAAMVDASQASVAVVNACFCSVATHLRQPAMDACVVCGQFLGDPAS